jgi:hypothetical protein
VISKIEKESKMPMFNVKVFQPHFASRDHESYIRFLELSNNVVEADTAKKAFQTVVGPLPRIEGSTRKLLEDTLREYVGKKGYSAHVVKMVQNSQKVWVIPSQGDIRLTG